MKKNVKSKSKSSPATTRSLLQALKTKHMWVTLLLGFSSGLPFLLTSKTLQTWLSYTGASTEQVSLFTLVGVPYSLKVLWSPFMDRFSLSKLGRRRSWLLLTQIAILMLLILLSRLEPVRDIYVVSIIALLTSFFGASQDIVVDAYRREILQEEELGLGSSIYSMGYRVSMWLTGGLALILTDYMSWNTVYLIMGAGMLIGICTTLWSDEPPKIKGTPKTFIDSVILPLKDFLTRDRAVLLLLFVLIYKIGDAMAGNVLPKFYQELGFSAKEVGLVAKTLGITSVIAGTFIGGVILLRVSLARALFLFGVLQGLSTLSFAILNMFGHNMYAFAGVVFFEDFSSGMGSAAFMAYMATLTNKSFTAVQYALLTSLMAIPMKVISAFSGSLAVKFGWQGFFILCALLAIPGLFLIRGIATQIASPKN